MYCVYEAKVLLRPNLYNKLNLEYLNKILHMFKDRLDMKNGNVLHSWFTLGNKKWAYI